MRQSGFFSKLCADGRARINRNLDICEKGIAMYEQRIKQMRMLPENEEANNMIDFLRNICIENLESEKRKLENELQKINELEAIGCKELDELE